MHLKPELPRPFYPLVAPRRFKGAKGGRGSGKSHFWVEYLIMDCTRQHLRIACVREVQNSIKDSIKQTIEDKIARFKLGHLFKITDREIIFPPTESLYIFRGLQNHTATSIKSLEGYNRVLYEEAQALSQRSIEIATPTFRVDGTEQLFAWNPDLPDDPVDVFFRENKDDPDFICVHVNYYDNPKLPADLRRDMERDKARDPDKYAHIWLGDYRRNSETQVFRNWKVESFDTPHDARFYLGADWGFSVDPSVLVRCFIKGRTLYVDREVWQIGCNIDQLPRLFDRIDPNWTQQRASDPAWRSMARRIQIVADSARPETISYMQRAGFNIQAAIKGPGSIEDGIEFLKSYDIVVHPACKHVVDELRMYSYEVDKKTQKVTGRLEDKKNHTIDSLRYALENVRRSNTVTREELRI